MASDLCRSIAAGDELGQRLKENKLPVGLLILTIFGHILPLRAQRAGGDMPDHKLLSLLRGLEVGDGSSIRINYEEYLRSVCVIDSDETLADHPEIALDVYRDWQGRPLIACVFARLMARNPDPYDVEWEVVSGRFGLENVKDAAQKIATLVAPAIGQEEAIAILLPGIDDPGALIGLCKALGQCDGWNTRAPFNPSDKWDRCYIRITTAIGPNVDAEVLGVGPFDFLPATRRAPILALHVRTKAERAKSRGHNVSDRAHLADIEWPEGRNRRFNEFWNQTAQHRLARLGGNDSAARARITFAIPRQLWEAIDIEA